MSSKKRVKSASSEDLDHTTDKKQKTTEETSNGTLFDLGRRKLTLVAHSLYLKLLLIVHREIEEGFC